MLGIYCNLDWSPPPLRVKWWWIDHLSLSLEHQEWHRLLPAITRITVENWSVPLSVAITPIIISFEVFCFWLVLNSADLEWFIMKSFKKWYYIIDSLKRNLKNVYGNLENHKTIWYYWILWIKFENFRQLYKWWNSYDAYYSFELLMSISWWISWITLIRSYLFYIIDFLRIWRIILNRFVDKDKREFFEDLLSNTFMSKPQKQVPWIIVKVLN